MEIIWKILIGIISYILGGLTVHIYYKKTTTINKTSNKEGNNIATNNSIAARNYHNETNIILSSNTPKKVQEPSEQAKSIMKLIAETGEERLVTFEQVGIIEELLLINSKKTFPIIDRIAIPEDINTLIGQGYLNHYKKNNTGDIYVLTPKGREYGKKLLGGE